MRLTLTGYSWCYVAMGSCYNGFVFELYEIGVVNGSCFKHLCSLQKASEMQTEQAEKSRRTS